MALAEPNRLRIVELLRKGPRNVGALQDALGMTQPQVSKHLRVLREAHLVDVEAQGPQRLYELRGQPLHELSAWLEGYRHLWGARLDKLEDVVRDLEKREQAEARARRRPQRTKRR